MRNSGDNGDRNGVQVVHRATAILMALRGERDGLSLSQISERVGLPRSTVYRLVAALEQERFVVSASPSRGFRLGPALASLAVAASRDTAALIHPFLVDLSAELHETVDLAVLEHDHILFVDQVAAATQQLRVVSALGALLPAHCTANGKALLAALPNEEVERLLPARLKKLTPKTITSRAKLLEELDEVRATGVGYSREEHTTGICAVSMTVDSVEGPVGAVSVPLPAQRFYGSERALVAAVRRTRGAVNEMLGAAP